MALKKLCREDLIDFSSIPKNLYKIFDTDALNTFLIKTTNVAKNKIFTNLKSRRRNIKNIFKVKGRKKRNF